jgi:redox-sensitive bicupin YhaK (pirin superfamily)
MQTYHRPSDARGHANHGWLDTFHSFSFADYHDPQHMGFRALRVINEDTIAGGGGFPTHAHADMEIVTYIVDGALEHRDSLGTGAVIRPGDAQRMSAGTGIRHSEFNASQTDPVHLLQIWIMPDERGIAPSYEQAALPAVAAGATQLDLVAGPEGGDGAVKIHADVRLHRATLAAGGSLAVESAPGRQFWVQAVRGTAAAAGKELAPGDGLAVRGTEAITLTSAAGAELLVFDLA